MKSLALIAAAGSAAVLLAYETTSRFIPQNNSSFIDANGTAHVTRVVPVPETVSPEARRSLSRQVSDSTPPDTLAERRRKTDTWQSRAGEAARAMYPVNLATDAIAGVPVRIVTPLSAPREKSNRVLINLHGGGFNSDSGSLTESIPVANLTQTKVVAVLYRLAPEHPFPAAVEDAVAVYKALLKTYKPQNIGIYGTSAGAILTAEVAVKLAQSNLPLPAALGIFSGMGDFSRNGDSTSIYALDGFSGPLRPASHDSYVSAASAKDPVLSPIYADLKNFPPTLFVTSTRDLLLSGTTILHRAFLRAGVDAQLIVFEALPHAFWNDVHLPESQEMHQLSARFFDRCLGH